MATVKQARDITVARPFLFSFRDGTQKHFAPGLHRDVGDEVAEAEYTKHFLLKDGEQDPTVVAQAHDPAVAAKRIASLEEDVTRLQAEIEQHKGHALRAEQELVAVRAKADQFDSAAAERDDFKAKNAALEADVERLTKPPVPLSQTAVKPTVKPT